MPPHRADADASRLCLKLETSSSSTVVIVDKGASFKIAAFKATSPPRVDENDGDDEDDDDDVADDGDADEAEDDDDPLKVGEDKTVFFLRRVVRPTTWRLVLKLDDEGFDAVVILSSVATRRQLVSAARLL